MKLTTILLGLGILVGATGWAAWEHRSAQNIRKEAARLSVETEELRAAVQANKDKIDLARRELRALDEEVIGLEQALVTDQSKPETEPLPLGEAAWQANIPYIDLPKFSLTNIHALVLNADDEIMPEAATLYGLTTAERGAVQNLYKEMTARFEQLERDHLRRTNQHNPKADGQTWEKLSFAILPFPAEADALKAEWSEKLKQLVGTIRADFITEGVRDSSGKMNMMSMSMRNRLRGNDYIRLITRGQNWLNPNPRTTHITFLMGEGASIEGYFEGGNGGMKGAPWATMQMPERWRHLITEEMLRAR